MTMPQGFRRTAILVATAALSVAGPAGLRAQNGPRPLPIESALRDIRIAEYDRPDLSTDGERLAYVTTHGPPESRPTAETSGSSNGPSSRTPSSLRGARLHLVSTATGEEVEVNPGDWSNWGPSFAPDGQALAFFSDAAGGPHLWLADATTGEARAVTDAPVFARMWTLLDRPRWTADGSSVYVLVRRDASVGPAEAPDDGPAGVTVKVQVSGEERLAHAEAAEAAQDESDSAEGGGARAALELVRVTDGQRRVVHAPGDREQIQAFTLSPSGRWIVYAATASPRDRAYTLVVVPASGGTARSLGEVQQIVYDGPASSEMFGSVFKWSPARDQLIFARDSTLWLVDFTADGPAEEERLGAEMGRVSAPTAAATDRFDQPTVTADGRAAVARLPVEDTVVLGVFPLDGSAARRLAVAPGLRFLGLATARGSVLWQPAPASAVIQASDLVTGELLLIRVDLTTGETRTLVREHAEATFLASADPASIVVHLSDARTPPNLYLLDGTLRDRRRITLVDPSLDGLRTGISETFATRAPSYDGTMRTVKTSVLLPPGWTHGEPLPAIVYIYPDHEMSKRANRFGGGRLGGAELALFWTSRGYAVIFPDLTPMTPILEGGGGVVRELTDYLLPQLYRAADLGYVDLDRLVLTGFSYGGYGTVAMLTRTNLFRAAVAYASAPLDLFSTSWAEWPGVGGRIRMGADPWSDFKDYLDNSPFHHADRIRTPLLLVHGTADNVPPAASEQMFRGLEQLGRTAQLALYQGEPHYVGSWHMANAVDVTRRVLDFVERYCRASKRQVGPGAPSPPCQSVPSPPEPGSPDAIAPACRRPGAPRARGSRVSGCRAPPPRQRSVAARPPPGSRPRRRFRPPARLPLQRPLRPGRYRGRRGGTGASVEPDGGHPVS